MPYYARVIPTGAGFDAVVDAHWADAIHVSHDHATAQDAQDAAEATARGLNLRDYETLVTAGFSESDLPVEGTKALDPEIPEVKPLPETKATKG
jgi:hypothetical protein